MNQINWGPVVIIILGYALGLYFQNKRLDDFKEGLYKYLGAEFKAIDDKFKAVEVRFKFIEDRLDKIEKRLDRIEENSKLIK